MNSPSRPLPAAQIRALNQPLKRTELLGPEDLDAYRMPLVAAFLAHARANASFYKDRLDFDLTSPQAIHDAWSRIPILTRAEAVANQAGLFSQRVPPEAGRVQDGETSGSTGMPLRYKSTDAFGVANCALTERLFRWWRVDGNKPYAQIVQLKNRDSRDGETAKGWQTARPNGTKYTLSHIFDIDTQLAWLLARKPAYLTSFAGIIKELAATTQRRGLALKFDLVFSAAAMVTAETRELCRSAFGAEIADTYGAQETGYIAGQCPDCGEYHTSADASVIEILRDDGAPAAPGEIGRVIVTPLYNYAMPFIRYELGDCAEVGTAEPACGRRLPTIRRILSRYRNLFRFRDGTRIWPVATRFKLHEFMALKQFQIVQTDFDHIEINYVPDGEPGPIDLPALTQRIRTVLSQPVEVMVHAVEKIERAASGKFEDCVSRVPAE